MGYENCELMDNDTLYVMATIETIQHDTTTINEHNNKEQKIRKFVILNIKPKNDAKKQKK